MADTPPPLVDAQRERLIDDLLADNTSQYADDLSAALARLDHLEAENERLRRLDERLRWFQGRANECALGWSDAGCFWHFHWGPRGTGNMLEVGGEAYSALDAETLGEALDDLHAALAEREDK